MLTESPDCSQLVYRPFTAEDLAPALELSQSLGWTHRDVDWALLAELGDGIAADADGRTVGTGFLWTFEDRCTLGMMLVADDMQRRGIGRALMARLLARAGDLPVTLVATEAGRPLYEQLGFAVVGHNWLHMGDADRAALNGNGPATAEVVAGAPVALAGIAALDRQAAGCDRARLLAALEARARRYDLVRTGAPVGYAYLRPSGLGHTIGPVVAGDWADGLQLIAHCASQVEGPLRIDIAVEAPEAAAWLAGIGMPLASRSVVMRRGAAAASGGAGMRILALTNQALG